MKKRFFAVLLAIFSVVLLITGCQKQYVDYSLRQDRENVVKIEICSYEDATRTRTPIVELSEDDSQQLLTEFSNMTCMKYFPGDHPRDYGIVLFCIYYADGEIEVIGESNIGWISSDGTWNLTDYTFDYAEMKKVIQHYVPEEFQPTWID